jgi:phage terminase large subunit
MFADHVDLFDPPINEPVIKPWRPEPLSHSDWPPHYGSVMAWRMKHLATLATNASALQDARAYYKTRPAEFIMHWMDTYDPRKGSLKWRPFIFFDKQADVIAFFHELRTTGESGLVEKCRDAGVTWLACAYSVWSWLFIESDAIGWGSRKELLVDRKGDVDSIFEKMRLLIRRLPPVFLPHGFSWREHATHLKLVNPDNGSTITGEAGANIGRGGRKSIYFKDESAHYEHPESIEAALGDNTNVQIDICSVNGLGNVFHRRRSNGVEWSRGAELPPGLVRVLTIDWSDHPEKTQAWYEQRKAKAVREGLQHIFAQEVDRDYSAAVQSRIIDYEWIKAAVDAHLKIPYLVMMQNEMPNIWKAALDVADEGGDRNALTLRQWIIARKCEEWGERDTGHTTRKALEMCAPYKSKGISVDYDAIGVGSGVKAEYNRLRDEVLAGRMPETVLVPFYPWNAGGKVVNPFDRIIPDDDESLLNKDMFGNFKAQAWWHARTCFYKTWRAVHEGVVYRPDELISLDSTMLGLDELMKELAQPTKTTNTALQMIIDKRPEGLPSPNRADSFIMCYFPAPRDAGVYVGSYGV